MSKRANSGGGSSRAPAAKRTSQRPITDLLGPQERCPRCKLCFATVKQLIEHVEAAHFNEQQEPEGGTQTPLLPQPAEQEPRGEGSMQTAQTQPPQQHQQAVEWWKQRPADPVVAHIRFAASGSSTPPQQPVRLSALPRIAPVELVLDVLEGRVANSLLAQLLGEAEQWVAGSWWFAGLQQSARHTSCVYSLEQQLQPPPGGSSAPAQRDEGEVPQRQAGPLLQAAAATIADAVSARMAQPQRAAWAAQAAQLVAQLTGGRSNGRPVVVQPAGSAHAASRAHPPQAAAGEAAAAPSALLWRPTYVLANHYRDAQSSVGSHSDRLSALGPLPTIASVSLGATRVFRLHPVDARVGAAAAAAAAAAGGSSSSTPRVVSSIDIELPHRSLLIMWPPGQEQWKHEVPKTQVVPARHSLCGSQRINLTFRRLAPAWAAAVPQCRCGRQAIMRCRLDGDGSSFVYYYACDNTQGPGCGLHQPAVVCRAPGGVQQRA